MSVSVTPTVSVIMPCYNAGAFVLEAVESVLAQTGASFELLDIIVVDDRSTDMASRAALQQLEGRDRVRVLVNKGRKGCSGARNYGIAVSKADWIVLLDADDVFLPDALESRFAAVAANPDITWVGTDFRCADTGLKPLESAFFQTRPHTRTALYAGDTPWVRLATPLAEFVACPLALPSCIMVRRDRLINLGMFDETLDKSEDIDLWLRLAMTEDYLFVRRPLVLYRLHDKSITAVNQSRMGKIRAYEKQLDRPETLPLREVMRKRIATFMTEEGYIMRQQRNARGLLALFSRSLAYVAIAPGLPLHALRQWLGLKLVG